MKTKSGLRTFAGGVTVVTGAGSGIGRAVALELARRGAAVVLADVQDQLLREVASEIETEGGRGISAPLDVTDPDAVQGVVERTFTTEGRLDYLFSIAGIMVIGQAESHRIDHLRRIMDVNFGGVLNGVHAAYPLMLRQGFGHIVNMASVAGVVPMGSIGYAASKHAVVGLSLALRCEAAAHGLRVSVVCPGRIRTAMLLEGGAFGIDLRHASPAWTAKWRETVDKAGFMDAAASARQILRGVARNQAIMVFPRRAYRLWRFYRRFPRLALRLLEWQHAQARAQWELGNGNG